MLRIYRAAQVLGLGKPKFNEAITRLAIGVLVVSAVLITPGLANAAGALTAASVGLSDPRPSAASVTYTFTGSSVDGATAVKCVKVVWSTGSGTTQAPTGFSGASGSVTAASSTLINSSATGWSLAKSDGTSSSGQNNIYQYTNTTGVTPGTTTNATFIIGGITNSSVADTSYIMKLNTYANTDCATGPIDNAVVAFINTNGSTLDLTVDPTLTFTVGSVSGSTGCNGTTTTAASTSTTIPFGSVTSASNGVVCQDLAASTNATNGYTIFARYTAAPTNGLAQTLADWTGTNASPTTFPSAGTEAYGYSTDDATLGTGTANRFTSGGQKWAALTTTNAEVGYESAPTATTHYIIGHQVGVSNTTNSGTYTTTVIYTCTPTY